MSRVYDYVIVRYAPDVSSGESLNVGVILCDPSSDHISVELEDRPNRLACAFSAFSRKSYYLWRNGIKKSLYSAWSGRTAVLPFSEQPQNPLPALVQRVFRDAGLAIQFSEERSIAGYAEPSFVARQLFERYVVSQRPADVLKGRKKDEDVWRVFKDQLQPRGVLRKVRPFSAKLHNLPPLEFEYGLKGDEWHLLQPMSFDYEHQESIREKAIRWLGYSSAIENKKEIAMIYFLAAPPAERSFHRAYDGAIGMLQSLPIASQVIEERHAAGFAKQVASLFVPNELV